MGYTPKERAKIRKYLGGSRIYANFDTALESSMDTIGADPAQADLAREHIAALDLIEKQLAKHRSAMMALEADGAKVDPVRSTVMMRSEGRRICQQLAVLHGFEKPISDAFSATPVRHLGTLQSAFC